MSLLPGENAIPFEFKDVTGKLISHEHYRGKKLLLSFYRYAGCPLCNMRIQQLKEHAARFENEGLLMVAIFHSDKDKMFELMKESELPPFPLIPDPKKKWYKAYEVENSILKYIYGLTQWGMFRQAFKLLFRPQLWELSQTVPADFLVDEQFRIQHAYYGKHIGDHIPLETIDSFLKQSGHMPSNNL